jgi:hypothetical protein
MMPAITFGEVASVDSDESPAATWRKADLPGHVGTRPDVAARPAYLDNVRWQ